MLHVTFMCFYCISCVIFTSFKIVREESVSDSTMLNADSELYLCPLPLLKFFCTGAESPCILSFI